MKLAVATAWFIACGVLATPCVSAQADAATAEPWQPSAGSDYPANVQRPRQPPAQQSSEDFENSRPRWRPVRRPPSRPPEASGVQRASFETDQPSRPVAAPGARIAQGGSAFRDEYGREYGGPGSAPPPFFPYGGGADEYGNFGDAGCDFDEAPCNVLPAGNGGPLMDRLWVRGDYLLWWMPGFHVPALVTTSPTGTPMAQAGRLDQPGTSILFGNDSIDDGASSGGRVVLGCWLTPCHQFGIEGSYLGVGSLASHYDADSSTVPILARPFYNIESGSQGQDAEIVSYPNVLSGSIAIRGTSGLQAIEALSRTRLLEACDLYVDFLLGYRYGQLQDTLEINESTTSLSRQSLIPLGTTFQVFDGFDTQNQFNGGVAGVEFEERYCGWSLDILMKLALGSTHSRVAIDGSTTTAVPGTRAVTYAGGVLAQPTNIGVYEQDFFTAMPELGIAVGYDITCRLRVTCGYTILYWSKVVRPGDQIDTQVNPSQFPPGTLTGAPYPQFTPRTTDFWAQGLNVGLELRF